MNDPSPPIIELFGPEVRHCTEPFASSSATAFHRPDTLPYGDLKCPGAFVCGRGYFSGMT